MRPEEYAEVIAHNQKLAAPERDRFGIRNEDFKPARPAAPNIADEDEARRKRHEERDRIAAEMLARDKLRAEEANRKEQERKAKRAEKALARKQLASDLLNFSFNDPEKQKVWDKLKNLDYDALKPSYEKMDKKMKGLDLLQELVKDGDLNDIAPELAARLPQLSGAKDKYTVEHSMMKVAVNAREVVPEDAKLKKREPAPIQKFMVEAFLRRTYETPELEKMLHESPVKYKGTDDGSQGAVCYTYGDGSKAIFKCKGKEADIGRAGLSEGEYNRREVAAYEVNKILGWDLVPPTGFHVNKDEKMGPTGLGAIMKFVDGVDASKGGTSIKNVDQVEKALMFDTIMGNSDRHGRNWLVNSKDDRLWLIDNGATLPRRATDAIRTSMPRTFTNYNKDGKISDENMKALESNKDKLLTYVEHSIGEEEADIMEQRIDWIIEHRSFKDVPRGYGNDGIVAWHE
jgi:hypothetical protein